MNRPTVAERLDRLFRVVHSASEAESGYDEVADGVNMRGLTTTSGVYIEQLRRGERDDPTPPLLESLADYFGVAAGYFSDDDELVDRIDSRLELSASIRDVGGPMRICRGPDLRDMSPGQLRGLAATINEVAEIIRKSEKT